MKSLLLKLAFILSPASSTPDIHQLCHPRQLLTTVYQPLSSFQPRRGLEQVDASSGLHRRCKLQAEMFKVGWVVQGPHRQVGGHGRARLGSGVRGVGARQIRLIVQLVVHVAAGLHVAAGVQVGAVAHGHIRPGEHQAPEVHSVAGEHARVRPAHAITSSAHLAAGPTCSN